VGELILRVIDGLAANGEEGNSAIEKSVEADVLALTGRFPIYA
jgi:glycine hydroxymethyltransferase